MNKRNDTPLVHIVRRAAMPWYSAWGIRLLAILAALILCGVITTAVTGENPLRVYATMIEGSFGTARRTWTLAQSTAMLLGVSLAVTPAFRMRFWNIGGEGQIMAGGLAAAACMICLAGKIPDWAVIIAAVAASIAAGALWAFIPAFFRAKFNTNETLFTLMMNYVAIQLVAYFIILWEVPKGAGKIGIINQSTEIGWLPVIGGQKYLLNVIVILALTVFMYVYLKYSKHGYEIAVVGESEKTARYVGIKVERVIIRTMLLSGAVCGLVGLLLVSGTDHTITTTISAGRGFTAVIISWMSKFNPIVMVFASLLLAFLDKGAGEISTQFGFNQAFADIITGIILFFIIGCEFFINYRLCFRRSGKKEARGNV